ncbi:hypothetical protein Ctob_008200 [Chrysochromulina tobinii]|uniref:Tetratricopeptide repeat protein n=1 Tax=Chrysochromulina tobinii TaxID=1460289 RepID=A0A0M0J8T1_9EUKA|nr:hypothetical protein Ctob_008200 [Chrysochromulina tobinii]|eukprot:KOO22895.1 hypothetical protein Ctob_008200 [Chrysochromulina sp. CCMP291]
MAIDGAPPGSTVRIHNLQSRPGLNGTIATLGAFISAKGRYAVEVPPDGSLLLKPDNLELLSPPAAESASDAEDADLMLEGNDDDDDIPLEDNGGEDEDEDDGLALEDNEDEDCLELEDNDDVEELALEDNEDHANDDDGLELEGNDDEDELQLEESQLEDSLEEALRALNPNEPGTLGLGVDGLPVQASRFLIPSAQAALEEAWQLYPKREAESARDYQMRVLQMLTASPQHCRQETFTSAASQIAEAYGIETIAERMRAVGDDHFAAGAYVAAAYAYTAGIDAHTESGDRAELMHALVNRSAAFFKLGQTLRAVDDANLALEIAGEVYAPRTQRKALLRRAAALFELGRIDAATRDLDTLGDDDEGASRLRKKIAAEKLQRDVGHVGQECLASWG